MTDNKNIPVVASPLDAQLPAHIAQYAEENSASSMITGHASCPSISIKGKQFKVHEQNAYALGAPIDLVILGIDPPEGTSKTYYDESYTEGTNTAPRCASSNGIMPDPFITGPQSPTCAACPKNVFGSSVKEDGSPGGGKACSDIKNLYVVLPNDINGPIYLLRVPATSLKALSAYGRWLRDKSVPPQVVITRFSFADAVHPQLAMQGIDWLPAEVASIAVERAKSPELLNLLPSRNVDSEPPPVASGVEVKPLGLPPAPPPERKPEPKKVMTAKAAGATYQSFIDSKWTDEQMISNGYMTIEEG